MKLIIGAAIAIAAAVSIALVPSQNAFESVTSAEAATLFGGRCYEEASARCGNNEDQGPACELEACLKEGTPVLLGMPCFQEDDDTPCLKDGSHPVNQTTNCGKVWSLKSCAIAHEPEPHGTQQH